MSVQEVSTHPVDNTAAGIHQQPCLQGSKLRKISVCAWASTGSPKTCLFEHFHTCPQVYKQDIRSLEVILWNLPLGQVSLEFTCLQLCSLVSDKRNICFSHHDRLLWRDDHLFVCSLLLEHLTFNLHNTFSNISPSVCSSCQLALSLLQILQPEVVNNSTWQIQKKSHMKLYTPKNHRISMSGSVKMVTALVVNLIIDCEAGEIIHLVASVRPFACCRSPV